MIKGFTAGTFDLVHAGHIKMFKESRENCDHLIVALQKDPSITPESYRGKKKDTPIMSLEERLEILRAIKYIDEVVVYRTEEELYLLLKRIDPDIRFLGEDWRDKEYTGKNLPIKVFFNKRDHGYSTTELKKRIYESEKMKYNKEE